METSVGVIVEAKKPTNKAEMIKGISEYDTAEQRLAKLNTKAFQELVLYYHRERITHKNLEVKHLIVTNINEWYIFDAILFDRLFAQNKELVKQFSDFEAGRFQFLHLNLQFWRKRLSKSKVTTLSHVQLS
jgi:adenine-specific DNA-methyltransferase